MDADFKIPVIKLILVGLIIAMLVIPAYAEEIDNTPVSSDLVTITPTETPVDERLEGWDNPEYLKTRWMIWNFTHNESLSQFWIYNQKAPDIYLSELILRNDDTNESIPYVYSQKTTMTGESTDTIWNLWGILNPDDKLSKNETLQVVYSGHVNNISAVYRGITITYMEEL
jgi:hypothetical protein